ncbi:MAG: curli production assembly protein CsgG [Candidatus Melainabacteria bacterium]|nr:curli production assembly protein CsgG [Candidatus Melainabacteria bacterium]
MKLRIPFALLLALLMVAPIVCQQEAMADAKRRVAIMPFEYGAVSSEVGTLDVGKGIVSLIVTRLVNDGTYSVVERQMLDTILKEQNFSVSDRADHNTACKIGKLLSVDAIVVGTITQFGFENKNVNVGAAASAAASYIPYVGGFGFGGLGVKKGKCKVAIDARVVDINTGEILAAVNGSGESKRSGVSLFGGGGGGGSGGWGSGSGSFDMGSSGFASTIAGEATLAAVDQVCLQIEGLASKVPDNQSFAAANVQGKVADVTGSTVIVNVGKSNGLNIGDSLQVERAYKTVKDPSTGKVLKELCATIGVITLSQVDPDSATGTIVRGNGLHVGDNVRKVTTDVSAVVLTPLPSSQ